MEIPRVVLARLRVGIGGHRRQAFSETDASHLADDGSGSWSACILAT